MSDRSMIHKHLKCLSWNCEHPPPDHIERENARMAKEGFVFYGSMTRKEDGGYEHTRFYERRLPSLLDDVKMALGHLNGWIGGHGDAKILDAQRLLIRAIAREEAS